MKQHVLSISAVAFCALMIGGAAYADCGHITIASMTWQSAEVTAELDKMILEAGYGCDVEIVPGDTVPSLTSIIEKQSPMLFRKAGCHCNPNSSPKARPTTGSS